MTDAKKDLDSCREDLEDWYEYYADELDEDDRLSVFQMISKLDEIVDEWESDE